MGKKYIFVKRAQGQDGGFGDYCSPDWKYATFITDKDDKPIWFDNEDTANEFIDKCKEFSDETFYANGKHYSYDGKFPIEYALFPYEIPDNDPVRDPARAFESIKDEVERASKAAAFYDYYDEDEDYENDYDNPDW